MSEYTVTDADRILYLKEIFTVGKFAMLRSGGPLMTVAAWREDGLVSAEWFSGSELMRDAFHPLELTQP